MISAEIDLSDPRRPGGALGAAAPELPAGATIAAWVAGGDVIHLDAADEGDPRPTVPWELVECWIPVGSHPDVIDGLRNPANNGDCTDGPPPGP